jgi:hypothetical protein
MKRLAVTFLALVFAFALAAPAVAGDKTVTLEGKVICAKCTLKEKGFDKCQNVLVVEQAGKTTHYYIEKNEAGKEFGDVCLAEKSVRVKGSVSEKDGRMWIAATEIVTLKSEG